MQIKDLSVKAERLEDVRGGLDINTAVVGSSVYAYQGVAVGGPGSVQQGSPTNTNQQIDASTNANININAMESWTSNYEFNSNASSFFSGWTF